MHMVALAQVASAASPDVAALASRSVTSWIASVGTSLHTSLDFTPRSTASSHDVTLASLLSYAAAFAALDRDEAVAVAADGVSAASGAATGGGGAADGLVHAHELEWSRLWRSGVEIEGRHDVAVACNGSLYALLSSLREDAPYSISPGGLASGGCDGHVICPRNHMRMRMRSYIRGGRHDLPYSRAYLCMQSWCAPACTLNHVGGPVTCVHMQVQRARVLGRRDVDVPAVAALAPATSSCEDPCHGTA